MLPKGQRLLFGLLVFMVANCVLFLGIYEIRQSRTAITGQRTALMMVSTVQRSPPVSFSQVHSSTTPGSSPTAAPRPTCDKTEVQKYLECAKQHLMSAAEEEELFRLLRVTTALLDFHNITYVVWGGTLLAILRNSGRRIPVDDDVDLILFQEDRTRIRHIVQQRAWPTPAFLTQQNLTSLNLTWFSHLTYFDNFLDHRKFSFEKSGCIKVKSQFCWPFIDGFFYSRNRPNFIEDSHSYSWNDIFPRQRAYFENIPLWVPKNVDAFMEPANLHRCCTHWFLHREGRHAPCVRCVQCRCLPLNWEHSL